MWYHFKHLLIFCRLYAALDLVSVTSMRTTTTAATATQTMLMESILYTGRHFVTKYSLDMRNIHRWMPLSILRWILYPTKCERSWVSHYTIATFFFFWFVRSMCFSSIFRISYLGFQKRFFHLHRKHRNRHQCAECFVVYIVRALHV